MNPPKEGVAGCGPVVVVAGVEVVGDARSRVNGDDTCGLTSTGVAVAGFVRASNVGVGKSTSESGSFFMVGSSSRMKDEISTFFKSPILIPPLGALVNLAVFALMITFLSSRSITLDTSSDTSVGISNVEIFRPAPGPILFRGTTILRLEPGVERRIDLTLILRSSIKSCFSAIAVSTSRSEDCRESIVGRLLNQLKYLYCTRMSLPIIRRLV